MHVKVQGCTKLCKFYIVDSCFNPIIGVNCALMLGLIAFKTPINENWSDNMPIDSVTKNSLSEAAGKVLGDVLVHDPHPPAAITKDRITTNPICKHLFQGTGCFKCNPVTTEGHWGTNLKLKYN